MSKMATTSIKSVIPRLRILDSIIKSTINPKTITIGEPMGLLLALTYAEQSISETGVYMVGTIPKINIKSVKPITNIK